MIKSDSTPRLFDSKVISTSNKRLGALLEARYSKFQFITDFELALRAAEHERLKAKGQYSDMTKPATKSIMAATLNCNWFNELHLQALPIDEHLSTAELSQRRAEQGAQLWAFIAQRSRALGLETPSVLVDICGDFIEMWQPTTCTYDELTETICRAQDAKRDGLLPSWFDRLYPLLAEACDGSGFAPKSAVYEALALLKVADEASITSRIWRSLAWPDMRINVAITATRLANAEEFSTTSRAANILETLWGFGDIYAGVQLTQMLHHVLPPHRRCLKRAEVIIDEIMLQYQANPGRQNLFGLRDTHVELFVTYNETKIAVLQKAEAPDQILHLTQHFIETALYACQAGLKEFAACTMAILRPDLPELQGRDFEELFDLRKKISRYPAAEAYCRIMANRAMGLRR
ncbi:hypothetical protein [Pseudomonas shirazensis]|uniref:hypothetical protein n=1 Tax=Pseudomonas shirazensis TaxID=2745494 RepID=UPI003985B5BF